MRTTLPVGTLPGSRSGAPEPDPAESIEESLRRLVQTITGRAHEGWPVLASDAPPRLPELGSTRNDWPVRRQIIRRVG